MNYPESIYNKYEIIEKDIYGEKHYCLVRIYSIFGIMIRRKVKVVSFLSHSGNWYGYIGDYYPNTWHKYRSIVETAIERDNEEQEWKFREKVTK